MSFRTLDFFLKKKERVAKREEKIRKEKEEKKKEAKHETNS